MLIFGADPFQAIEQIRNGHIGIAFVFGIQGAPGRAAGTLQGPFSFRLAFLLVFLGCFPAVSDGPMMLEYAGAKRKVSYLTSCRVRSWAACAAKKGKITIFRQSGNPKQSGIRKITMFRKSKNQRQIQTSEKTTDPNNYKPYKALKSLIRPSRAL